MRLLLVLSASLIGHVLARVPSAREDFYMHVNGEWLERTVVPENSPMFSTLYENIEIVERDVKQILLDLATVAPANDEMKKLQMFFAKAREPVPTKMGYDVPLVQKLNLIAAKTREADMRPWTTALGYFGGNSEFEVLPLKINLKQDTRNSERAMLQYGFSTTISMRALLWLRKSEVDFKAHVKKIHSMVSPYAYLEDNFEDRVYRMARKFSRIIMSYSQSKQRPKYIFHTDLYAEDKQDYPVNEWPTFQDKAKNYEKPFNMTEDYVSDADILTSPSFSMPYGWKGWAVVLNRAYRSAVYLSSSDMERNMQEAFGGGNAYEFMVADVDFYKRAIMLMLRNRRDMIAFIQYETIVKDWSIQPTPIADEYFRFYKNLIYDGKGYTNNDDRATFLVKKQLPFEVSKFYVQKYFQPESKEELDEFFFTLRLEMTKTFEHSWLSESTKAEAIRKLMSMTAVIGYPRNWTTYTNNGVEFQVNDSLQDMITRVRTYHGLRFQREVNTKRQTSWRNFPPITFNMYLDRSTNNLVFPAAVWQPPLYYRNEDEIADVDFVKNITTLSKRLIRKALNLGAMGSALGHEVGHAYDVGGKAFDSRGNMREWWTAEDLQKYNEKSNQALRQMESFTTVINGTTMRVSNTSAKMWVGEHFSDIIGTSLSIKIAKAIAIREELNVFQTWDFLDVVFQSWAWSWKTKYRDIGKQIQDFTKSTHPYDAFRARAVANTDEFQMLYETQPGDGMYLAPDERIQIWN